LGIGRESVCVKECMYEGVDGKKAGEESTDGVGAVVEMLPLVRLMFHSVQGFGSVQAVTRWLAGPAGNLVCALMTRLMEAGARKLEAFPVQSVQGEPKWGRKGYWS
jgi:hypothetical protein